MADLFELNRMLLRLVLLILPRTYRPYGLHVVSSSSMLLCDDGDGDDAPPAAVNFEASPPVTPMRRFVVSLSLDIIAEAAEGDFGNRSRGVTWIAWGGLASSLVSSSETAWMETGSIVGIIEAFFVVSMTPPPRLLLWPTRRSYTWPIRST
jgi:hypothetical protein